jgi:ubiquinone/menaquinone biosynthesis C-methylase UbiE
MVSLTAEAKKEFDSWSRRYDWDPLQLFFFRPSHRMLLDTLAPADERILDIGCGTCQFGARVLAKYPRSRVWGLDLCAGMLRGGQERSTASEGRMHRVQGDSSRLPFADNSFDAITCTHSFHHYPDQGKVIGEMHRVLRPGGRLLIIDGDRDGLWGRLVFDGLVVMMEGPVRHLSRRNFRKLYRDTGFDKVMQRRRGGPLPFLMTCGQALKSGVRSVCSEMPALAG